MRKTVWAGVGGLTAAGLGSLCCIGPILFVTLGVGAGAASTFESLRPLFGTLMVALLGIGFYTVYAHPAPAEACGPDGACERPRKRGQEKVLLWGAAALALILWTFPQWSILLV